MLAFSARIPSMPDFFNSGCLRKSGKFGFRCLQSGTLNSRSFSGGIPASHFGIWLPSLIGSIPALLRVAVTVAGINLSSNCRS